ncbi:MAG: glycoside hydrolase family 9 protein [Oscillospiraceae bacterium]|nr:glycoside hydrolase family 9 protein [Oscillospiraceae bacterium]
MDYNIKDRDAAKCPFGIFADQAGYFPEARKRAVIPFKCSEFSVVKGEGNVVFTGKTEYFGFDEPSGDEVYIADFSEIKDEGCYRITAGGQRSAEFRIARDVYKGLSESLLKAFYYLRCGCGLTEEFAGKFAHAPCHTQKAVLWENRDVSLDVSGGWHDAGDYGRYVTAAACALSHLLYGFKMYPKAAGTLSSGIPESGNGLPDLLNECRYELEWLMKMQSPEGGAYHKVTTAKHAPFVMPEEDREQLYIFPVSSMATADMAAVCALAAGVYREYDGEFAERLKCAALAAYKWLEENPKFIGFDNPEGCGTGGYGERDDYSNCYWAAAEMYALTGEEKYHEDIHKALQKQFPLTFLGYEQIGGQGSLAYLLCPHKTDPSLRAKLIEAFTDRAAYLKKISDKCGYGVAMGLPDYHWGSSMEILKRCMVFKIADFFSGKDEYKEYALGQIHCIMGVNALGYSYVTGQGDFCCNDPHLRPAYADGIEECIPGFVAGGANGNPCDGPAKALIPEGTPPMKCYADVAGSYSLNEVAIYWNSPGVMAMLAVTENE